MGNSISTLPKIALPTKTAMGSSNRKYQVDQMDNLYLAYNDLTIIIINLQGTGLIIPLQSIAI